MGHARMRNLLVHGKYQPADLIPRLYLAVCFSLRQRLVHFFRDTVFRVLCWLPGAGVAHLILWEFRVLVQCCLRGEPPFTPSALIQARGLSTMPCSYMTPKIAWLAGRKTHHSKNRRREDCIYLSSGIPIIGRLQHCSKSRILNRKGFLFRNGQLNAACWESVLGRFRLMSSGEEGSSPPFPPPNGLLK